MLHPDPGGRDGEGLEAPEIATTYFPNHVVGVGKCINPFHGASGDKTRYIPHPSPLRSYLNGLILCHGVEPIAATYSTR
ncbi:hypothetical protein J6590_091699 [Homalodisca vitripennis]|nr:hypothetical protein J6590_087686 [Homalodisca vitripennis]KAG8300129.1 hypothetical protein J6590_083974 [Homalodisca vitripennis]KAG8314743.1 hypothetical protein J6590_085590 [Homalodisca vitripennis]KAG8329211.1 hypothetical protein J6590_091699 [Homalodisca vitripennis]